MGVIPVFLFSFAASLTFLFQLNSSVGLLKAFFWIQSIKGVIRVFSFSNIPDSIDLFSERK